MTGTVVNVGSLPDNVQKHSKTANAHAEGAGNICKDMLEKVFAPVAGPMAMYIFYILLLLGVFVVFLVLGGISAVRMASETVTEVKQTLQTSIPYPDIYICIPASERYNLFVYEDVIKKNTDLSFMVGGFALPKNAVGIDTTAGHPLLAWHWCYIDLALQGTCRALACLPLLSSPWVDKMPRNA
jgi:hypothetical protein